MKKLTVAIAFVLSACATTAPPPPAPPADRPSEATEPSPFRSLTWDETAAAVQAGAVLIDARRTEGFDKGHIPGALSIPWNDEAALARLPADKAARLVFYCGGPRCDASTKVGKKAQALGYTDIGEYSGGYPEWATLQVK